ncbi:MAG: hypothetical protein HY329_15045 [Chloroflexi bacterium]|nr:hypothetical protein [Chloroflexota bacterium]
MGFASDRTLVAALARWRRAAGPFADFVNPVPFLNPLSGRPLRATSRYVPALLATLESCLAATASEPVAVFLDIPPAVGLAATARLGRRGFGVVPIYERLPLANAIVPGDILPRFLVWHSRQVAPAGGAGFAFLLDAERWPVRPPTERQLRRRFDNRYRYDYNCLPPIAVLRTRELRRVIWLSLGGIAPELGEYAGWLADGGLALTIGALSLPGGPAGVRASDE